MQGLLCHMQDRGIWLSSAVFDQQSAWVLAACPTWTAKRRTYHRYATVQARETNWASYGHGTAAFGVRCSWSLRPSKSCTPFPCSKPEVCWDTNHMGYGRWHVPQPICSRCEGQAPVPNHIQVHSCGFSAWFKPNTINVVYLKLVPRSGLYRILFMV